MTRVFILAGEPSGDRLGGAVMAGLKALRPDVTFQGIGGPEMALQGLQSQFEMSELSVMGLAEVLPKYLPLKRRIRQTVQAVLQMQPDVLITIDAPDFSLRVAKQVKAASSIRTVHYVAPTVWAWRPKRAEKMARWIDHVLALFPFEPPLMQAHGMACDFVGHPVVGEKQATAEEAQAFRAKLGIGAAPLMLILPGSRQSEIARLSLRFGQVVSQLRQSNPDLHFVLPAAAAVADQVRAAVGDWPVKVTLLDPNDADARARKRAAFRAADVALAASGSVSLELAAAQTPMVIAADMSWVSRVVISRMLLIDTVTLVNLISDTRAVPEFLGDRCTPGPIAGAVLQVLANPDAQQEAMALTLQRLGQDGEAPGLRAARAVLGRI